MSSPINIPSSSLSSIYNSKLQSSSFEEKIKTLFPYTRPIKKETILLPPSSTSFPPLSNSNILTDYLSCYLSSSDSESDSEQEFNLTTFTNVAKRLITLDSEN